MQPLDVGIAVLVVHGLLVAFDAVYHRAWCARLTQQPWAARELELHSGRAALHALIFAGLAWFEWQGAALAMLALLAAAEFALSLAGSAAAERTREVPATERIFHTVLGISTGAWIGFVFHTGIVHWWPRPTAFAATGYGLVSWLLTAYAAAAAVAAVRDALAAQRLARQARYLPPRRRPVLAGGE